MTNLSQHFTLAEMTVSNAGTRAGLVNIPTPSVLASLYLTADKMEKVRSIIGHPIQVLSGYRSPAINSLVGGSKTSDHRLGLAVDWRTNGLSIADCIERVRNSDLPFDQLIDEFGAWVHTGFGRRGRRQVLRARKVGGKTVYTSI